MEIILQRSMGLYSPLYLRLSLVALLFFHLAQGQNRSVIAQGDTAWVNQKMKQMTRADKIGQLFVVAAYSNKGPSHEAEILSLVQKEKVGGLIFFQGTPERQAELSNRYQGAALTPLLIAMDAEWGLAMRLDQSVAFPWPLTLGATRDSIWAYRYGQAIGQHCRRLGVHLNFAPVLDVNTNPLNPIIGQRSLGESPQRVSILGSAFMRGMQEAGVMACAKHFPGHGDTDRDSHKTLPTVAHNRAQLRAVDLFPYRKSIAGGLASAMVAHLNVPALDPSGTPSSLSRPSIDYLRDSLAFDGLIVTDALNMQGVARQYPPGEVDLAAFLAGNDLLLFSQDVALAKKKISAAIDEGLISEDELNRRVRKILMAKSWAGLGQKRQIEQLNLRSDLNRESDRILTRRIFAEAATLLINHDKTLPVSDLGAKKIACITAGVEAGEAFPERLKDYTQVEHFRYSPEREEAIMAALAEYDLVIFGLYTSNQNPWKSYKIGAEIKRFVRRVSLQNRVAITLFANPYSLLDFPEARQAQALLVAYQNHPLAEQVAAEIVFGALGAKGSLPVSAGEPFEEGLGLHTQAIGRLGYAFPGELGLDAQKLLEIDALVEEAIRQKATPGAQVIVARHGKVVYQRNFGHHRYDKERRVDDEAIYDLASITKIAVTVPLLMKLTEEGKLNLDNTLGHYLPQARGTNKEDLILREILAHKAGLQAWIPFYMKTLKNGLPSTDFYRHKRDFNFPHVVAEGLYAARYLPDTVLQRVLESPLLSTREYKYSDLGYYLFQKVIERVEGRPIDELIHDFLYQAMGASSLSYHPLKVFPPERIVPTEDDRLFRGSLLQGYVHDQGAAMLGGVGGHAGLFGKAMDMTKLMQMYLQKGHYAGIQYFDSVTVEEFIRCQYCEEDNRRGAGFDKPQLSGVGPTCGCTSPESFGHSGFTGTLAWADPAEGLVYVFLSNRVHPDAENRKLLSLSTRTQIQQVIYDAIQVELGADTLLSLRP